MYSATAYQFCFSLRWVVLLTLVSCTFNKKNSSTSLSQNNNIEFDVVKKYPHNPKNFTQGFEIDTSKEMILESTGQHNSSRIVSYPINPAQLNEKEWVNLDGEYFGEGISVMNKQLVQLTWKNEILFVYDYPSFKLQKKITIPYEGWGITNDGERFIVSDGTSKVRWLNPTTFETEKTIKVHDELGSLDYINELELADSFLYANRWQSNKIMKIDTVSGKVLGFLDVSYLSLEAKDRNRLADVANGIAYHPNRKTFFLTGKYWPYIYEVKLK